MSEEMDNKTAENEALQPVIHKPEGTLYETFYQNLTGYFKLPADAADWLVMVYDGFQFFDDVVDGDDINRKEFDRNLYSSFIGMHLNPFYAAHQAILYPQLLNAIIKWQASDIAERDDQVDEKTFMWRAGYFDLVLSCVTICHGYKFACEKSVDVMNLYSENFKEYKDEFNA